MKLVKFRGRTGQKTVGLLENDQIYPVPLDGRRYRSLTDLLEESDPEGALEFLVDRGGERIPMGEATLLPPLDEQEVWAAGVTYGRSRSARMEESEAEATCYDRVYEAARPELFFKSPPYRAVGHRQPVRIRRDSKWNVPEPELTLVISSRLELVGFTIGNDMSSRDIEGENPLYLPQAKVYDGSCAVGPCITLANRMPPPEQIDIEMVIRRGDGEAFRGSTNLKELARTYDDLIGWLTRETSFPKGALLMTGTGIVPDSDFTLEPGDVIEIEVDGIGTLVNPVAA